MTTDKRGEMSGGYPAVSARARILAAFDAMLLGRERKPRRAGTLAARAGVARSTFYDHFRSAGDVELAAMARPLGALADLASGSGDGTRAEEWITHFWDYRQEVRPLLAGAKRPAVQRLLETLIAERSGASGRAEAFAPMAAAAILAAIDAWVHSRFVATPAGLTGTLARTCTGMRESLLQD